MACTKAAVPYPGVVAPTVQRTLHSEIDFLAWAELLVDRVELVEGEIVMQAGAWRDHERVAIVIFAALPAQVDPRLFDVTKAMSAPEIGAVLSLADIDRKPRQF